MAQTVTDVKEAIYRFNQISFTAYKSYLPTGSARWNSQTKHSGLPPELLSRTPSAAPNIKHQICSGMRKITEWIFIVLFPCKLFVD